MDTVGTAFVTDKGAISLEAGSRRRHLIGGVQRVVTSRQSAGKSERGDAAHKAGGRRLLGVDVQHDVTSWGGVGVDIDVDRNARSVRDRCRGTEAHRRLRTRRSNLNRHRHGRRDPTPSPALSSKLSIPAKSTDGGIFEGAIGLKLNLSVAGTRHEFCPQCVRFSVTVVREDTRFSGCEPLTARRFKSVRKGDWCGVRCSNSADHRTGRITNRVSDDKADLKLSPAC